VNDIGKSFSKRVDLSIVQSLIDQHLNQVDSMDPFLNTEDINQLSLGIEIASEILTEEEYIMNLNVFESHEKLASFVELINRDITLKRLILQDESMDIYKELVSTDDLIALLKSKDQVDQFLKERSIVINLDDGFIRTVLELQEGNEH
jgi:hypothetical protein